MKKPYLFLSAFLLTAAFSCEKPDEGTNNEQDMQEKLNQYVSVKLTTDLSALSENQRKMIPLLIDAAKIMDSLFWYDAYGQRDSLLAALDDEAAKKYVRINYGPWDRLDNNTPFIEGVGEKPPGANFYPADMTKEEFQQADLPGKDSLYTFVRRDSAGALYTVPYHEQFAAEVRRAAALLEKAAVFAEDDGLRKYLELRAEALRTDRYRESDLAWMDMKNNTIELVIGPIETYEDRLFGYKAAHEAYVLVKDRDWSQRLEKYAAYLPELQQNLPVEDRYKQETPGSDADLNAYDVIYYAGDCNSGGKTIAINLPNDEQVQLQKGTRRLQLKNAMRAKFDHIMLPITEMLIDSAQRANVTFDAFFANTMFHEVAHGLGIKNTLTEKGTVREALKEHASALEEGKADILGLYMIMQLLEKGELDGAPQDYMTTFMAGIFRSVRFGASSAHGIANMIRFNYFREQGAFQRLENGTYRVDFEKMQTAADSLSRLILTLQGNGDYEGVAKLVEEKGRINPQLQSDLDRLGEAGIPVDVVFEQGVEVLGL